MLSHLSVCRVVLQWTDTYTGIIPIPIPRFRTDTDTDISVSVWNLGIGMSKPQDIGIGIESISEYWYDQSKGSGDLNPGTKSSKAAIKPVVTPSSDKNTRFPISEC